MDAFRDNKLGRIINVIIKDFGFYLSISLGIFIFILFFQPFSIEYLDFNNSLLFTAGLSCIVFIVIIFVRNLLPLFFSRRAYPILPPYSDSIIILVLSSVAFAFFLRYVGSVKISFYLMSKVIIVCLFPPSLVRVYDMLRALRNANISLMEEKEKIEKKLEDYEEDYLTKTIDFPLEGKGKILSILVSDIACIKSADNYVELVFHDGGVFKRQLIRNTLKNIEQSLKPYPGFLRCHRTCIVNRIFIEKLVRRFNNYSLIIKGYDEQVPVSRQYLVKIREAL